MRIGLKVETLLKIQNNIYYFLWGLLLFVCFFQFHIYSYLCDTLRSKNRLDFRAECIHLYPS